MIRLIICGGRGYPAAKAFTWLNCNLYPELRVIFNDHIKMECIAEGGATGADQGASNWADFALPSHMHQRFPMRDANDGPARNMRMFRAVKPNVLVAFPGGHGTASMISIVEDWNAVSPEPIRIIYP